MKDPINFISSIVFQSGIIIQLIMIGLRQSSNTKFSNIPYQSLNSNYQLPNKYPEIISLDLVQNATAPVYILNERRLLQFAYFYWASQKIVLCGVLGRFMVDFSNIKIQSDWVVLWFTFCATETISDFVDSDRKTNLVFLAVNDQPASNFEYFKITNRVYGSRLVAFVGVRLKPITLTECIIIIDDQQQGSLPYATHRSRGSRLHHSGHRQLALRAEAAADYTGPHPGEDQLSQAAGSREVLPDHQPRQPRLRRREVHQQAVLQHHEDVLQQCRHVSCPSLSSAIIRQVFSMDLSALMASAQSILVPVIIYVVPFLIGFILGIFLWTCLCCCCTCPSCCPSTCCKCCRKDDEIPYTKCELIWPAVFLLLVLALAIAASIPGITQAGKLVSSVQTMECGLALALDDISNGNMTVDQTNFFFGISTLIDVFHNFSGQISNIGSNIHSANTRISDVITTSGNIMTSLQTVASTTANASAAISYTDPTPSAGTVNSLFNSVFGNPTNTSSIVGKQYQVINGLKSNMTSIQGQITTVETEINSGNLNNYINTAITQFSPITGQVNDYTNMIVNIFENVVNPNLEHVKLGTLIFFAVAIGLSSLALIGLILTAFFDKAKCRYLMYASCVLIVIIVLLGFLITLIFSLMSPLLYMTCGLLNESIDTNVGFNNFINSMNISGVDMVGAISVCFPGGNGEILTALNISQLDSLNDQIANMTGAVSGFEEYMTLDTTFVTQANNMITDEIASWVSGTKNDLVDASNTAAITYLTQLANSDTSICNDANFLLDSLVTSTNDNSTAVVNCQKSPKITCGATGFSALSGNGCIDMTDCFSKYSFDAAGKSSIIADITARYPSCAGLATVIGDLFDNWDIKRRSTASGIGLIGSNYAASVSPDMITLENDLNNVKGDFTTAFTNLNSSISEVVDPQYGLMKGLNCRVLGEDIVNAKNTICVSLFNSVFFLLVTMGTTSFALLFALCCITCTGVRHYKQDVIKGRVMTRPNDDPYDQTFVHLQNKQHYP